MLLSTSGFVTICPKKEVELGADKHLHRADHHEELRQEIEFEAPSATGNQYAFLPGGAVRAVNPSSSMTLAETSNCIAVFKGNLLNKAELALQVTGSPPHITEAQLLLHLYEGMGIDMLSRLHGQYAFCLYDSKQARVLAARDHSGVVPLLEGRTAAGSMIIACGTYLPEEMSQITEIKAGEYKYGWHALPRPFKCGHRIIAGRASCDYGIRRRSIDAYNAPPARQSVDLPRQSSMEVPRQRHSPLAPTSHSYSHTPGKYMPPHLAAAAAGGASNSSSCFSTRQRSTSYDGHHLQQQQHHGTSPAAAAGGRRKSEINTAHHGNRQHQHQYQHWMPKSPLVVSAALEATGAEPPAVAAAVVKPRPLQTPAEPQDKPTAEVGTPGADAATTPCSASTSSGHHRRRRRHHRRRSHSTVWTPAEAAAAAAAIEDDDDAHSESGSHVSSSTHDSVKSSPQGPMSPAASSGKASLPARQASRDSAATPAAAKTSGKKQHKPTAGGSATEQQQQQQLSAKRGSGSGGFKRNSSCGELAALSGSPAPHSVLLAAPQGMAC